MTPMLLCWICPWWFGEVKAEQLMHAGKKDLIIVTLCFAKNTTKAQQADALVLKALWEVDGVQNLGDLLGRKTWLIGTT